MRLNGYERRRTWELSGGQQQRVALARALVNHPTVLLLDEPLGALDRKLRHEMQIELKQLQREVGITFIYVTHDQEEALTMSDVIVVMRDGRIQQQGHPELLYQRPGQPVRRRVHRQLQLPDRQARRGRRDHPRRDRRDRLGLQITGRLTDDAASPAVGADVTVAIRPEAATVEPATDDAAPEPVAGQTRVAGRVRQGTYLGDTTEYRVQTEAAGELVVRRQNIRDQAASRAIGPGEPVVLSWHEEANLILSA